MSDDDDAETWLLKFISNFPHVILDIYLWKAQSEYELFSIPLLVRTPLSLAHSRRIRSRSIRRNYKQIQIWIYDRYDECWVFMRSSLIYHCND